MAEVRVAPLLVVTPVRNEARYIRHTLDAMVAQAVRPAEWIVVDDGSTDETAAIVGEYARQHAFVRLHRRQDRGFRQLGAGVVAAFEEGCAQAQLRDYRYLAKLDGDLSFGPRYLEIMLDTLEREPRLATVSGKVYRPEGRGFVEEFIRDDHTAGQFKLYKREAFEAIGGFVHAVGWDAIDVHRCRMIGWEARSFEHPEARLIHHRLMGSSDQNIYKGRVRLGRANWHMGYHPLYAIASGVFRMHERPWIVGGLITIAAYFFAALRGEPRIPDAHFREHLQRWQLAELRALPRRLWRSLRHVSPRSAR
jgi:poly-beta-1,6-N-acetyl-D-glucosamine synthase